MMVAAAPVLIWRLRTGDIGSGKTVVFSFPDEALGALAKVIGVDRVLSGEARLHIEEARDAAFDAKGAVTARCVQTCGVTLEPFETEITESIAVRFAAGAAADTAELAHRDDDEDGEGGSAGMVDLPEPIIDGVLDLGAITQEFLALAVDPYPRKPDATFAPPAPEDAIPSPFAALSKLRDGREPGGNN